MSALTNLQTSLSTSFATLSQRERRMVAVAGIAVAVFAVFMVAFSFSNTATSIRRRTAEKVVKLEEVQQFAAGYRAQKATQDALERQLAASNVRLISLLEENAKRTGLELPSINPRPDTPLENPKIIESGVEVTLTDVKLNRLVDFLTGIEQSPGIVKVKYMRLEPRVANETVTAWLTIVTYHLK
jgi:general secretion pathway protein M